MQRRQDRGGANVRIVTSGSGIACGADGATMYIAEVFDSSTALS